MTGSSDLDWGLGKSFLEEVTFEQRTETSGGRSTFQAMTTPRVKAKRNSLFRDWKARGTTTKSPEQSSSRCGW